MAKYISNKKVYEASWDSFLTDNKSKSLREKIASKFSPRIAPTNAQKNIKDLPKLVPISLDRVPLPPPLLAKSAKEVNVISKYFQNKKPSIENKKKEGPNPTKSYA